MQIHAPTPYVGKLRKLKLFPHYVKNELKYLKPWAKQQLWYTLVRVITD